MKRLLELKLRFLARWAIRKYRPKVIAITGSIGKTSAKEAICCLLGAKFRVRSSIKNYNNELGVPLSILGQESGGRSLLSWTLVILKSFWLCLVRSNRFPEILILEFGIDHPGDMDYLLSIVRPDISLVTSISYSHLEFFGSIDAIRKEKQKLVENTDTQGLAIINFDSPEAKKMAGQGRAKAWGYGIIDTEADMRAEDVHLSFRETEDGEADFGLHFKLAFQGAVVPVFVPKVLSEPSVYACLAAAAAGVYLGMNMVEISQAFLKIDMPKGRMKLIKGIKDTWIVDDTYNSSPEAAISALSTFAKMPVSGRKFVVLGDMLELGAFGPEGHRLVGEKIDAKDFSILVTVGERARDIAQAAEEKGFSRDLVWRFDRADEAGRFLQNQLVSGDALLVKASQGIRLEKIVKELMADPTQAGKLLVRQGQEWD